MNYSEYTKEVTEAITYNQIYLDKDGIMFCRVVGNQDADSVKKTEKESQVLLKKLDYKPNVLIDLRDAGIPDSGARKVIAKVYSKNNYTLMAMYGMNDAMRVITQVILSNVAARNSIKVFKGEEEAREWLNENPVNKNK